MLTVVIFMSVRLAIRVSKYMTWQRERESLLLAVIAAS